jgi:signal transduction histidine kinase
VVHKIVESHGGRVRVESEPKKGTTVTVEVPLDAGAAGSFASPSVREAGRDRT